MAGAAPSEDEQLARARQQLEAGPPEGAAAACRELVERLPHSAPAHMLLAEGLARLGLWDEVVAACRRAAELEPELPGVDEALGDALAQAGRLPDARRAYRRAIEAAPGEARLHRKLGDLLRTFGHDEKAADAYARAAELAGPHGVAPADASVRDLYLELLKRSLTFLLWDGRDGPLLELRLARPVASLAHLWRRVLRRLRPPSRHVREAGLDWPRMALTMVGELRLDHVRRCVEQVLREGVPGDLIETGVWRGGVTIFMRGILAAHGVRDRVVWAADSFAGLPKPDVERYPADRRFDLSGWRSLAVPLEEVRDNFARFGLLDEQVRFLPGWFEDTLPDAPIERLAVMRLDGDLYQSTHDALVHLYPKLSPGGWVILDDYRSAPPCRRAVDDYRREHGITEPIEEVDWSAACWRRAPETAAGPAPQTSDGTS